MSSRRLSSFSGDESRSSRRSSRSRRNASECVLDATYTNPTRRTSLPRQKLTLASNSMTTRNPYRNNGTSHSRSTHTSQSSSITDTDEWEADPRTTALMSLIVNLVSYILEDTGYETKVKMAGKADTRNADTDSTKKVPHSILTESEKNAVNTSYMRECRAEKKALQAAETQPDAVGNQKSVDEDASAPDLDISEPSKIRKRIHSDGNLLSSTSSVNEQDVSLDSSATIDEQEVSSEAAEEVQETALVIASKLTNECEDSENENCHIENSQSEESNLEYFEFFSRLPDDDTYLNHNSIFNINGPLVQIQINASDNSVTYQPQDQRVDNSITRQLQLQTKCKDTIAKQGRTVTSEKIDMSRKTTLEKSANIIYQ